MLRNKIAMIGMVLAVCLMGSGVAVAQSYPSKPVRMIVPWPPGGTNDIVGRLLADRFSIAWRQPVIVENRGGSNGVIGTDALAKSPADGYSLMFHGVTSHLINRAIYPKLPYDPDRDVVLVSLVAETPNIIVVNPKFPAKTLKELIDMAKAAPGKYSFASFGNGSPGHLSGALFLTMAGVEMVHIPYRGGGPALADTMAGHVPVYFANITTVMSAVAAGSVRALAITTAKRSRLLPDLPTVEEAAGLRGYETTAMYGLFAPGRTPRDTLQIISREVMQISKSPEFAEKLIGQGAAGGIGSTLEEAEKYMAAEAPKWAQLVKDSGAALD
jgi:tripartite-type tricarboxylate transporter receptor subunit TctC